MAITRRVMAIVAVVAILAPAAPAVADDGGLVEVGLRERVVQLVADGDSTCALTETGDVYCWGADHPEPAGPGPHPLVLITLGALLVAGGVVLLLLSRPSPRAPHPGSGPPPA